MPTHPPRGLVTETLAVKSCRLTISKRSARACLSSAVASTRIQVGLCVTSSKLWVNQTKEPRQSSNMRRHQPRTRIRTSQEDASMIRRRCLYLLHQARKLVLDRRPGRLGRVALLPRLARCGSRLQHFGWSSTGHGPALRPQESLNPQRPKGRCDEEKGQSPRRRRRHLGCLGGETRGVRERSGRPCAALCAGGL